MASIIKPGGTSTKTLTAENTFTDPIQLNGEPAFVDIKGTAMIGTLTPQWSVDYDPVALTGNFTDFSGKTWTADASENMNVDAQVWVRIGFKTGAFTSGSVVVAIRRK
jgi:hypothetical protein